MNRQTYRLFRANARANGTAYAMRAHGLDMYDKGLMVELEKQGADALRLRQQWIACPAGNSRKTIILCTSPIAH